MRAAPPLAGMSVAKPGVRQAEHPRVEAGIGDPWSETCKSPKPRPPPGRAKPAKCLGALAMRGQPQRESRRGMRRHSGTSQEDSLDLRSTGRRKRFANGSEPQQIAAAYGAFSTCMLRVTAATWRSFEASRLQRRAPPEIGPEDRLEINVLVVDESGHFYEALAETRAATGLPRGPAGWRNWLAARAGFEPVQREEHAVHSDSGFIGEIHDLDPIHIVNTVSRVGPPSAGNINRTLCFATPGICSGCRC